MRDATPHPMRRLSLDCLCLRSYTTTHPTTLDTTSPQELTHLSFLAVAAGIAQTRGLVHGPTLTSDGPPAHRAAAHKQHTAVHQIHKPVPSFGAGAGFLLQRPHNQGTQNQQNANSNVAP